MYERTSAWTYEYRYTTRVSAGTHHPPSTAPLPPRQTTANHLRSKLAGERLVIHFPWRHFTPTNQETTGSGAPGRTQTLIVMFCCEYTSTYTTSSAEVSKCVRVWSRFALPRKEREHRPSDSRARSSSISRQCEKGRRGLNEKRVLVQVSTLLEASSVNAASR